MRRFVLFFWVPGLVLVAGLRAQTATVTPSPATLSAAGGVVTFSVALGYSGTPGSLGFEAGSVPAGWSFGNIGGANQPQIVPVTGDTGTFDFAWVTPPAGGASFTFTAKYPAGLSTTQTFSAITATFRGTGYSPQVAVPDIALAAPGSGPGNGGDPGGPTVVAPSITAQSTGATVTAGQALTLSVTASGTTPLTYVWKKDGATITGATTASLALTNFSASNAGTYVAIVSNTAGTAASAPIVLTLANATPAPAIDLAPASATVVAGNRLSLLVRASGQGPLAYQWFKDGAAVAGGTTAELVLDPVAASAGGNYLATVSNTGGTTTSSAATVTVLDVPQSPHIDLQPLPIQARAGNPASFTVVARGNPLPGYFWRKNGVAITGATSATLTLPATQASDAAAYDVVVSSSAGATTSSLVMLDVLAAGAAAATPVISRQPVSLTRVAGRSAVFLAGAIGPELHYQWTKDGSNLPGATQASLTLPAVAATDAGTYAVTIAQDGAAASVTSAGASLTVLNRSYGGTYGLTLGDGGTGLLRIREDDTGGLLAYSPATHTAWQAMAVSVDGSGHWHASLTATTSAATVTTRAATLDGTIDPTGHVTATGDTTLSGDRQADGGPTAGLAGYYRAEIPLPATGELWAIAGPAGQMAFLFAQGGGSVGGGLINLSAGGSAQAVVDQATLALTVHGEAGTMTGSVVNFPAAAVPVAGVAEGSPAALEQRLVNISTRTAVSGGGAVAIVGFVITGTESKTVLIRGVGPTLKDFGIGTALPAPKLELARNSDGATLATNTGWAKSASAPALVAAAARSGAFALGADRADSAILAILAPGVYSAILSAADGQGGVGLVEVYDLSGASANQKLVNISTRTTVGTGDAGLVSGLVVGGSAAKRVLIRAAGPALIPFGVTDAMTQPQLTVFDNKGNIVAQNAGWSTGSDAGAIMATAASAGAFAFSPGSRDAAILINLPAGAYTAQVTSGDATTGTALLEAYEVP